MLALAALAAASLIPCPAPAQDYPNRTIRMIVPFGAGGPTDVFTRAIGEELRKALGQPIVMENRPGAGTIIGTTEVARAAPDGYTLLMISATQTTVETLNPNKPYRLMRDFVPVAPLMNSELVLVVPERSPVNSLTELIALAKAKPGTLNYGSSGPGSNYHMAGELVKNLAGLDIVHVPYKGSTGARADIISGQIDMMFDSVPTMAPTIEGGRVKALGTSGKARSPVLPNVPTIAEAGIPGYDATIWIGVMAPAGTPKEIVALLNREINKILMRPDIAESWRRQGANTMVMKPEEFGAYIEIEIARWMNVQVRLPGTEHWTTKGEVKLFLWNKCAVDPAKTIGTILFVHGSSMASQPTFDLEVPGRPDSRRWNTSPSRATTPGASTWRATAAPPRTATTTRRSRSAPTTASRPRPTSRNCAARVRSSSTAFRRARCAPRCSPNAIPKWSLASRSTPWCGPAKARRRSPSGARNCPSSSRRTAARSTAPSCIRSSTAIIPAPPRTASSTPSPTRS